MNDLDFVSGVFLDYEISKKDKWLLHYFKTENQQAFLKYHLMGGIVRNFVDHTGVFITERMVTILKKKFVDLTQAREEAKMSLTEEGMQKLHDIETGNFTLT